MGHVGRPTIHNRDRDSYLCSFNNHEHSGVDKNEKMKKESECEFCELCREFYEGKKKECKGPEHCKNDCRKINADIYIDDKAVNPVPYRHAAGMFGFNPYANPIDKAEFEKRRSNHVEKN